MQFVRKVVQKKEKKIHFKNRNKQDYSTFHPLKRLS